MFGHKRYFKKYEKVFGQIVNFTKFEICFSSLVNCDVIKDVANIFGVKVVNVMSTIWIFLCVRGVRKMIF